MKNLLSIFMAVLSFTAISQGRYSVMLQSGNYEITEGNLQNQLISQPNEIVDGQFFRLVQYFEIPSMGQQKTLEATGVKILNYLPKNSFLMSFPVGYTLNADDAQMIRAISSFTTDMKLSKNLAFNGFPDYAVDGNQVKMVVHFYEVFTTTQEKAFLTILAKQTGGTYFLQDDHIFTATLPRKNWEQLKGLPYLYYLQEGEDPGEIENFRGRTSHRVNAISSNSPAGYNLQGEGVRVSLGDYDFGNIKSHIDYTGRMTNNSSGNSNGTDHGHHTSGTVFGAGNLDPDGMGMAPKADLTYYTYPSNLNNVDNDYTNNSVRITSTSFSQGCNSHTSSTSAMDKDIYDNVKLMHVFSAGNSNGTNCAYGAGTQWGNITGGHKQGKNVIATANLTTGDQIASSSSRGPAHDGRVKPDLGALGTQTYSTLENNTYGFKTGTSMSCPGLAGTLALVYEGYKNFNNGTEPDGGLAKALLMNTAEDLGKTHVDFIYGYGRINAYRAMQCIEDDNIITDTVTTGNNNTHTITVPAGTKEVRIMLYWTDKQATANANRALINNLDMVVTEGTNTYNPWVLDPTPNSSALNSTAVRAVDSLNNAEQFTLNNPASGTYTVKVTGASVPVGPQKYYIVYTFIEDRLKLMAPFGGEVWTPLKNYSIRWDLEGGTGGTSLEYSLNNGVTWTGMVNNLPSSLKTYVWNIPNNTISDEALVRAIRGGDTSVCASTFSIMRSPPSLGIDFVCPDSTKISWNMVPGAMGYVIHQLGTKYMDSVGTTTNTSYVFTNLILSADYWFSVSAIDSSGNIGERAIAINKTPGTYNCVLPNDVSLETIISPSAGIIKNCLDLSAVDIQISIKNSGSLIVDSVPVSYQINQGAIITETYSTPIAAGSSVIYTFSAKLNLTLGNTNFVVWTDYAIDQNKFNDTATAKIVVQSGVAQNLPFSQDFDSWNSCPIISNCELTNCNLLSGWTNETNGVSDDIDFRTNSGSTPSTGTGPTGDHTGNGNYLYLEASTCFEQTAKMQTPCINIPATGAPELSFWYHMGGTGMGTLSVDILVDGKIDLDVFTISGNQGFNWRQKVVSLTNYLGKTITVRFRGETGTTWTSDISIDDVSIDNNGIGINENGFDNSISVSPNPANANITIKWDGKSNKNASLVIYNAMGQTILEDHWKKDANKNYEISDWAKGVYFIHINYNDQRKVIKFVKQ